MAKIAASITEVTKKPKSLSVTRNGGKFSAAWTIADKDYGVKQEFAYRTISATSWTYVTVAAGTKAKSITIDKTQFYPTTKKTISAVSISVRGQRKKYAVKTTQKSGLGKVTLQVDHIPTMSEWANYQFAITPPWRPSLTSELVEGEENTTKFSWTIHDDSSDHAWFTDLQWESVLVKNCNYSDGSKAPWKSTALGYRSGTSASSSSINIAEGNIADASYTRWFRARSRGPGGVSTASKDGWVYAKHVYSLPYQATIKSVKTPKTDDGLGYLCTVVWNSPSDPAHPIDQTVVEWIITTPAAGMTVSSGASWTTGKELRDVDGVQSAVFSVPDTVGPGECLFVRVNNIHDEGTNYGVPKLADTGKLTQPTITNIQYANSLVTVETDYDPTVPGTFLVVTYKTAANPDVEQAIGVFTDPADPPDFYYPDSTGQTDVTFGLYAAVGTYSYTTDPDGVRTYSVVPQMVSDTAYDRGTLPTAPTTISAKATNIPGTIRVEWDWSWDTADVAELSWADHEDAWESTDEPDTYIVRKRYASAWNISGLESGVTWYVRVRLGNETADDTIFGPWSSIASIDLASAPSIPSLTLVPGIITPTGSTTASWGYTTTDGTAQAYAEIDEVTVVNGQTVHTKIADAETAQHVTISAEQAGWSAGETHSLVVRVASASGKQCDDWSQPVPIIIADAITATISQTSLTNETITDDDEDETTRTVLSLTEMPMTVTVTGAGVGGTTIVAIERAADFVADRPDERRTEGFEGETVYLFQQTGESQITITNDDLIGILDDGAQYRLVATVIDGLGQTAEATRDFEVHWTHQALEPTAEVVTDMDNYVSRMKPIAPTGWVSGDTCDIYRLSVDRPELIYKGATFGATYIDPYPTVGPFGGHRFVYVTANGDYITEDNKLAWYDTDIDGEDFLDLQATIIDFGNDRVILEYDMEVSNSWEKDFIQTTYLGGAVTGDWNPAIKRSGSVSARSIVLDEESTIEKMRRLAAYPGICHVRTAEGSSYAADVQVSEKQGYQTSGKIAEFDLKITRVDPEGFDAIPLSQWVQEDLNEME